MEEKASLAQFPSYSQGMSFALICKTCVVLFPFCFFVETQNISNCRISLPVLQGKNARCKGPKRDNDWSTWPSKRPRNSNTTSSASMWNLSLWMRNKHSSTMKNTSICFNRMADFTDLRDTFHILTYIYIHIHSYHIYIYSNERVRHLDPLGPPVPAKYPAFEVRPVKDDPKVSVA